MQGVAVDLKKYEVGRELDAKGVVQVSAEYAEDDDSDLPKRKRRGG